MVDQEKPQKKYGLFVLAIVLLLAGGATLFWGSSEYAIQTAGVLVILASIQLVRMSHVHDRSTPSSASIQGQGFKGANRPRRLGWGLFAGLVIAMAACYVWISNDIAQGGRSVLPVLVFGGLAMVASVVFGYLLVRRQ